MNSYTEATMENLRRTSGRALEQLADGKPIIAILRDIYCTLPDKSDEVGELMADRVLEQVDEYEKNKQPALANLEDWAVEWTKTLTADKEDCAGRCGILAQTLLGFTALSDYDHAEEILQGAEDFDPASASDALEQELRSNLIEAVRNCPLGQAQLNALLEALEDKTDTAVSQTVLDFGTNSREIKAIMSMVAYVNAKNGNIEELPPEITLDEVVPCVCLSCDVQEIAGKVETGEIDADTAVTMIDALGAVAGMMVTVALVFTADVGLAVMLAMIGLPRFLSIPVLFLAGAVVANAVREEAVKCATGALRIGWTLVKSPLKLVCYPGAKLIAFAAKTILPAMGDAFEKIKAFVRKLKTDTMSSRTENRQAATVKAQ